MDEILSQIPGVAAHLTAAEEGRCAWPLCEFVRRNPRYFALFRNESLTEAILEKITAAHRTEFIRIMRSHTSWTEEQLDILFRFQTCGCLALIRRSGGMDDGEWTNARETVDRFLRKGLEIGAEDALLLL